MRAFAEAFARLWERVWLREGSPYDLAAARIVFSLHGLWIVLSRDFPAISDLPVVFWRFVPESTRWRYLLFPGHADLEYVVQAVGIGALVAGVLGVAPRISLIGSALVLYHLAPLETIIWNDSAMERGLEVTILALTVLSFSPCADRWSLARRPLSSAPGWHYHWPLALIQLFVVEIYLLSGLHKLHYGGLAWMGYENIRRWMLALSLHEMISVHTALARYIADRPALCVAAGVSTVLLELASPIILIFRRARVVWVPLAAAFHVGILFTVNIFFLNAPQLLVFVNWEWMRAPWRARSSARHAPPHPEARPSADVHAAAS
jgi:hypothetical protein